MKINVVNLIPKALSGETSQDSEPNLAINPSNPQQMVATAFTPDPSGGSLAPIFISTDGGQTWALNLIVPGATTISPTHDITTSFGGASNVLYAGILRADNDHLNVLRTDDFTSSTQMEVLVDRASEDQPWVQAATTPFGDRVYIGHNDANTPPKTATVEQSLDAATAPAPAGFGPITIASRDPLAGGNAPSIRTTIHSSGTIYVAYFNWQSKTSDWIVTADVVVCRDDNWGQGTTPYQALTDPGDRFAGVRVAQSIIMPFYEEGYNNFLLGQERLGSHLSIAVDPNNRNWVYVAWADYPDGVAPYTIHVRNSADGGVTWSEMATVANGINPALAVNAQGFVGLLYQTLTNGGTVWETHILIVPGLFTDIPLAIVPSTTPVATFLPYLGDYVYLTAVGSTFYGVFSANNTPDVSHFPSGVTYQRNADFTTKTFTDQIMVNCGNSKQ